MASRGDDAFRTHWMALGLPMFFAGVDVSDLAPLQVHIRTGDASAVLIAAEQGVNMSMDASPTPGAVSVAGPPDQVVAFLTGRTGAAVEVSGPPEAVERVRELATRAEVSSAS
jgi:hypothetical protein